MATYCLKPFKGKVMRVVSLDACGAVVSGTKKMVVTDGFISVEQQAVYRDPTEYELINANGDYCLNERDPARLRWFNLTITLCGVDPELVNFMTGSPLVMNDAATPEAIGFRTRENVSGNFGLEVWTDLGGSTGCAGGTKAYGYFLLPWVKEGVIGDLTIENGAANFQVTQMRTSPNSAWGTGPFNVWKSVAAPAGAKLITAISATDHRHFQMTTLAPPTAVCGAQTLTPDA
jgi:hypothetical protein